MLITVIARTMEDYGSVRMEEDVAVEIHEEEEEGVDMIPASEGSVEDDDYEEEEDEDDDYEDELISSETTSPRVSSSITDSLADDSNRRDAKPVIEENGGKELNRGEIDVCSICFEAWTSCGDHRICCLPCGHIYGMSCIKRWLLRCQSSGKCPQCKSLCTLKDIRVLYASRLCLGNEISPEASATDFPYTKEGFSGFQKHVSSCMDSLMQRMEALERRTEENDLRVRYLEQRFNELMGQVQENISSR